MCSLPIANKIITFTLTYIVYIMVCIISLTVSIPLTINYQKRITFEIMLVNIYQ